MTTIDRSERIYPCDRCGTLRTKAEGGTVFTVTDIADGKVVLDGNHAWAGKRVRFECRIIDIRPATPEEIQHGHAHGPEGHHHH